MNENKAKRHINPEISPELFDEEKERKMLTVEDLENSEAAWTIFLLAALFGVIKIDGIEETAEKEEI